MQNSELCGITILWIKLNNSSITTTASRRYLLLYATNLASLWNKDTDFRQQSPIIYYFLFNIIWKIRLSKYKQHTCMVVLTSKLKNVIFNRWKSQKCRTFNTHSETFSFILLERFIQKKKKTIRKFSNNLLLKKMYCFLILIYFFAIAKYCSYLTHTLIVNFLFMYTYIFIYMYVCVYIHTNIQINICVYASLIWY